MRGPTFAIACALLLAGCGDANPQLAPIQRNELHALVERARTAAQAQDLARTHTALEALQARVRTLREGGRIDREMADQLLKYTAVTQLRARQTLPAGTADDAPEAEDG